MSGNIFLGEGWEEVAICLAPDRQSEGSTPDGFKTKSNFLAGRAKKILTRLTQMRINVNISDKLTFV